MNKNKRIITLMALSLLLFGCNKEKENEQGPVVNPNMGNVNTNTEVDPGEVEDVEPMEIHTKAADGTEDEDPNANANLTPTIKHGKTGTRTETISEEEKKERQKLLEEFGEVPPLEEHEYYEDIKVQDMKFTEIYLDEDDDKFHCDLQSEDGKLDRFAIVVRYYDENGNQLDYKVMYIDYETPISEDPNFTFDLNGLDPDKVDSISIEPFSGMGTR